MRIGAEVIGVCDASTADSTSRGDAAGRSAERGTSAAATGGGGRSAPDPELRCPFYDLNLGLVVDGLDCNHVATVKDPHPTPAPADGLEHLQAFG